MLVFHGFALGTNKLGESFTNSNNTLGNLVSLGFASGTKYTLCIITTLKWSLIFKLIIKFTYKGNFKHYILLKWSLIFKLEITFTYLNDLKVLTKTNFRHSKKI